MSERSLKAYDAWRDEAQRFDYFILGLIGAVTAYVVQNLEPHKVRSLLFAIQLAGLILLIAAASFGFRRIEQNIALLRHTYTRLEWEENLSSLVENYRGNAVRTNLGDVLTPEDTENHAQQLRAAIAKIGELQEVAAKASGKNYLRRNWCFFVGFILIAISRAVVVFP